MFPFCSIPFLDPMAISKILFMEFWFFFFLFSPKFDNLYIYLDI